MRLSKGYRKRLAAGVFGSLVANVCQSTLAQNLDPADKKSPSKTLEEIIVTAQKRAEDLQDVPISVSAFTGSALQNMGISDTQELQMVTPGVVFTNLGPTGSPYIRGVGTRLAINGLDPSIATYIQDRYSPRVSASIMGLGADVERVEVLKGPQGTLYGRNATGGAVRIIRKDVVDDLEGDLRASYGNYNAVDMAGTVNIPVSSDLGVRLSGLYSTRDGYVDNLAHGVIPGVLEEFDDRELNSVSARVRWNISDSMTADLLVDYWTKNDAEGLHQNALPPVELNFGISNFGGFTGRKPSETATDLTDKSDTEDLSGQLRIDVDLASLDLVSITTFDDFSNDWYGEVDGSSASVLTPGDFPESSETFSQEIQFISDPASSIEWIAGAFLYRDEHTSEVFVDSSTITISQGNQEMETTAYALFGQLTWDLNENTAITIGGRYSFEHRKVSLEQTKRPGYFTPGVPFYADSSWNKFTPRIVLEHHFGESLIYASYSQGFKSGGYNYPASTTPESLDPETLDMYELGLKGDFLNHSLRLATSIYYYDYKDLQVTRAASGTIGIVTTENAADAKLYGLDLDVTWIPTNSLSIDFGLNLIDSEYKDYDANAKVFRETIGIPGFGAMVDVPYDASGDSMLRASEFSYYVSANYEFNLSHGTVPVVLTYSYKDDFLFDFIADPAAKHLRQDGYGLLNGRVSYLTEDVQWRFSIWGRNLTDEKYFDEVAANGMGIRGSYASPRTYGVEVEYQF
ncbi:TonB-dependent receptor [Parahaliea maris]|uniref:TonB-dependent receptor n=1 Tax=Parahaliea maris TaxID=2716870 RepID=A0A5C9AAV5_9GAMM|nr:TonB-dependent receptor [Parahaliea maris]TXS96451.1 TonB-dependent receptor [Parahaliea maris]